MNLNNVMNALLPFLLLLIFVTPNAPSPIGFSSPTRFSSVIVCVCHGSQSLFLKKKNQILNMHHI